MRAEPGVQETQLLDETFASARVVNSSASRPYRLSQRYAVLLQHYMAAKGQQRDTHADRPAPRFSHSGLDLPPDGLRRRANRAAAARGAGRSPPVLSRRQDEGRAAEARAQPVHRAVPQN